jgi:hypothetical protein
MKKEFNKGDKIVRLSSVSPALWREHGLKEELGIGILTVYEQTNYKRLVFTNPISRDLWYAPASWFRKAKEQDFKKYNYVE